ncbi:hypothetical protein PGT21_002657 [Puccinia graminis f. sp. tritici]|uniref:Uncharacterized protein n=1 Tax=Puccinia graminis f. sp. tritici TaxID=56615 RepID=A0A5B0M5K7_PUCGR|nr:hypothetical protein PGTUg99_006198 [Puccinia graminis f. sp. tritici]KAA1071298.1 hypothetical protein PGT21_002657 [Puccinia graminis f. sp. tritici]
MSTNPNNLQSTAEQMRRNNANLARENADNADTNSLNPVNPSVPLNPPATLTQNNPPPIPPTLIPNNSSLSSTHTPTPIPPKQKNPPAAKAPTGSASQQAATRPANPSSSTPKHPLSLDEVATSAEKHRQSAKQTKDLAAILGAKTIDVEKAYRERAIATNATLKREAEKDEETAIILEKALKADAEGDKTRADMFYNIYAKLVTGRDATPATRQQQQDDHHPQEESRSGKKNTVAGGTNFNWGDANSHDDVGFTPYFDKNILELKGPLPLTIFNKAWQDAALAYHAEKKQKSDESTEKGLQYTGLPYPSEWHMSYSDWSLNYAEFTTTMRDVYKYETLGEWIVLHKTNADKILRKDGFMVALRYDIRVRANAFAHRVVKNGVKSFSDISIFRQDVYDTAYAEARRLDELVFREVNPYATGGVRASWDPHTGTKLSAKSTANPTSTNHHAKRANTPTQSGSQGPSHLPAKPRESRRGTGYQGKNYNPNHTSIQGTSGGRYHSGEKDGR